MKWWYKMRVAQTWPALLIKTKKGQTECEAARHPHPAMHFWKARQGQKQWGVHTRDGFREQQWVGGERKDNITGRKKKNTDKERENEREGARGGGEIRVTLCHSGTCSAYKLKEKPKVCHWVISLLSTSWGLGLDSDHVPAESAGPRCSQNSAWHGSRIFWQMQTAKNKHTDAPNPRA